MLIVFGWRRLTKYIHNRTMLYMYNKPRLLSYMWYYTVSKQQPMCERTNKYNNIVREKLIYEVVMLLRSDVCVALMVKVDTFFFILESCEWNIWFGGIATRCYNRLYAAIFIVCSRHIAKYCWYLDYRDYAWICVTLLLFTFAVLNYICIFIRLFIARREIVYLIT